MTQNKIDPDFDGHPEKSLKDMKPEEKLKYLSECIVFHYLARNKAKKINKTNFLN